MPMRNNAVLVTGASSKIAQAVIKKLLLLNVSKVYAVSRDFSAAENQWLTREQRIECLVCDYSEEGIGEVIDTIRAGAFPLTQVYICHGVLHTKNQSKNANNQSAIELNPEKRLEDIDVDAMMQVFKANTLTPALWLKHLPSVVKHDKPCVVTVFSARVGSISDNQLGGWYSYRASKAALNMLVKTAAVEYGRRAKNVKLIAFHPGTTDTPLSKPFQANVKPGKLFNAEFVAEQLLTIVANLPIDQQAQFLDWQGKTVHW